MVLNVGYIELGGGDVFVRFYYDTTYVPAGDQQPLVDGPRGYCMDLTNVSGQRADVTVYGVTGQPIHVRIGQGDPVTTGPATGRSRTAAELAAFGFTTRGNVGTISLE